MKIFEKSASRRRFFRRGLLFGGGLLAVPASEAAPANETLKAIHSLRTIHGDFSDKPVPDESVQTILDASVRAANASNSQTYSIIVSRDPAKIQKLTGYRATCLLLYCSDHTRPADVAKIPGGPVQPGQHGRVHHQQHEHHFGRADGGDCRQIHGDRFAVDQRDSSRRYRAALGNPGTAARRLLPSDCAGAGVSEERAPVPNGPFARSGRGALREVSPVEQG
jgi:hypothetical protein